MSISDFLKSGFDFDKNDYEKKLHYYLYNSILLVVSIMMIIFTCIRFMNKNFTQGYLDLAIVFISLISIYFLRKAKKYADTISNILLLIFFLLVSETFLRINGSIVGSSWYILFLMSAYFIGGKTKGIITTIFVFIAIIILGQYTDIPYDACKYFYVLMPLVMSVIFILLYEKRNLEAKKLLHNKNINLENEIKREIAEKTKLTEQSKELANVIKHSNIELYIVDFETDRYIYANNGAVSELGYSRDELMEMSIFDVNPYLTEKQVSYLKNITDKSNSKSIVYITKHQRKDGSEYGTQAYIHEVKFNNKKSYVVFDIDISEREKAQKELLYQKDLLAHQAYHDSLTNLPNRALLLDRLTQTIYKANRNQKQFALLFIDLDQFKQINDSLGHEVGDLLLKKVVARFAKIIRKEDTFARLGGDEFTIIMEDLKTSNDAAILAQKLLSVIRKSFNIKNHDLFITCSIGISLFPQNATQVELLLRNADAAMYKAKESGRNTFSFYTKDMTKNAYERVAMETNLRHAISKDEFVVYYQPQYNITTGEIIGVEALARWEHPLSGLIQPSKFIPLAEENGMIVEIDNLISTKAMNQYVKWTNSGHQPGKLNLNLTIKQLMHSNFINEIEKKLKDMEFNPKWLSYEITESQVMTNPEIAISKLRFLSDLGIEISIDDFGTGYSSLSYLKKLPIKQLKIDKSFIDDIPDDKDGSSIVKTIIALSKILNLQIIAEGVETAEQEAFLLENGCEYIQGYLYSKPLCSDDMTKLLLKNR